MDITKMTDGEIKSLGYDLQVESQRIQQNLQLIAIELNKRKEEKEKPVADKV